MKRDTCGCAQRAERRIEAASNWLQDFYVLWRQVDPEEFYAVCEEAEHTDTSRAWELLKDAAVVLENELKGWPG